MNKALAGLTMILARVGGSVYRHVPYSSRNPFSEFETSKPNQRKQRKKKKRRGRR